MEHCFTDIQAEMLWFNKFKLSRYSPHNSQKHRIHHLDKYKCFYSLLMWHGSNVKSNALFQDIAPVVRLICISWWVCEKQAPVCAGLSVYDVNICFPTWSARADGLLPASDLIPGASLTSPVPVASHITSVNPSCWGRKSVERKKYSECSSSRGL